MNKTAGSTKGEIHEGIQCLDSTVQTTMYNQRALMNSQSTEARHGRHMLIPKNSKRLLTVIMKEVRDNSRGNDGADLQGFICFHISSFKAQRFKKHINLLVTEEFDSLDGQNKPEAKCQMHGHGGYDSDFSDDEHCGESSKRKKRTVEDDLLLKKPFQKEKHGKVVHKQVAAELLDREEAKNRRFHLIAMDAYQRHTKFVNDYILYYGGKKEDFRRLGENDKTDMDVIRENHRFLWNEEDEMDMNWEKRLAKKYYDKLFKEYCIADLSRYKENKFGFRWRVEKEVISGKGQFCCGNKSCDKKEGLKSWEVNFGYTEHGEKRNALVKLRLCQECSFKLNFHHRRKEIKSKKRKDKAEKDSEESTHKKSRLSSVEETSKTKDKAHSSSVKSESSVNRNSDEEESASESELWKGPLPETDEKSQEEEFDEYFQDLFL